MEEVVYFPSKKKLTLAAIGSLVFVLVGIWMLTDESASLGPFERMTGAAAIVFFGLCLVYVIYRLVVNKQALTINRAGIVDNASAVSVGFVAWEEIACATIYSQSGNRFIGIELKSPDAFLSRVGPAKRKLLNLNLAVGAPLMNIPETALPVKLEIVYEQMERFSGRKFERTLL